MKTSWKVQKIAVTLILLCSYLLTANAQSENDLYFYIDLPLYEHPFNSQNKFSTLSMQQSIKVSKSFYYATHYGIEIFAHRKFKKRGDLLGKIIMTIFDTAPIPLSNTWLHEEFHRTILSLNEIKSKNTHWTNSVKRVNDEDLIHFKLNSPQELVREATAGNEGNLEFVHTIQKDVFFDKVNTWNYGLYWGNYLVNSFYIFGSTREGSNPLVRFKNSESHDVHERDVNGFDPINATYDLFNPYESYEERGIHPSGVGIDRYVEFSDLSLEAQDFLRTQFSLSLLNFVDLNLFGIDELGKNVKYNLSLRHHMTSFGYMLGANVFLKTEKFGAVIKPMIYKNQSKFFPGMELELRNSFALLRMAVWDQPENQLYFDTEGKLGATISGSIYPISFNNIRPYFEFSLKTDGWLAANPFLDQNFSFTLGLTRSFNAEN